MNNYSIYHEFSLQIQDHMKSNAESTNLASIFDRHLSLLHPKMKDTRSANMQKLTMSDALLIRPFEDLNLTNVPPENCSLLH